MCDHTTTIDDISTGDEICTQCGSVRDKIYVDPTNKQYCCSTLKFQDEVKIISKSDQSFCQKHFSQMCEHLNVPTIYSTDMFTKFHKLKLQVHACQYKDLCVVCILAILKAHNCHRMIKEVAWICNTTPKKAIKVQAGLYQININQSSALDFLHKYCMLLSISCQEESYIAKHIAQCLNECRKLNNWSPRTVVSGGIYLFSKHYRIKLHTPLKCLSKKAVSNITAASQVSIRRFCTVVAQEYTHSK
jgi:transcription initiation factor TFIIIB Brf1 subunit/transcription initiation factor TFIIB